MGIKLLDHSWLLFGLCVNWMVQRLEERLIRAVYMAGQQDQVMEVVKLLGVLVLEM